MDFAKTLRSAYKEFCQYLKRVLGVKSMWDNTALLPTNELRFKF